MNLLLVCFGNFQDYIIENIKQLISLKTRNIFVITNQKFFQHFRHFPVTLVDADELVDKHTYCTMSHMDKNFRNGFWVWTSYRFFLIYECMKKFDLEDCIHIENDVLLYYDIELLNDTLDKNFVYISFDCFHRNIASIIFIPNHDILGNILEKYDMNKNDMENFIDIASQTNYIKSFPIFPSDHAITDEEKFVSQNYTSFIFDAAAMGQYLGGVDPQNDPSNTVGFVNETCVIKYNRYNFDWKDEKPFLRIDKSVVPIFNLHIHSKQLHKFTIKQKYDVVILLGPNEYKGIEKQIDYTKKYVLNYRNIYIITDTKNFKTQIPDVVLIDENIFPFTLGSVADYLEPKGLISRTGWYFQQLVKLYCSLHIETLLPDYLILDADVFFLTPLSFRTDEGKYIFTLGDEYHTPYFEHMAKLHPFLKKMHHNSGISHHMIYNREYVRDLFRLVEKYHEQQSFWRVFLECVKQNEGAGASEYEIYFNYMLQFHSDKTETRKLNWRNVGKNYNLDQPSGYDFVSLCYYL